MSTQASAGHRLNEIHVTRWGTGPTVLLIHGSGQGDPPGGAHKWRFQRGLADQGWGLVVPDRPGQGESPSQGPDDFELDAPWAAELLANGAHVVGHSYGGAIALCAAGLRPDAIHSLTLIEAPIFQVAAHRPEAREQNERIRAAMTARIPLVGLIKAFKVLGIPRDAALRDRPSPRSLLAISKGFRLMRAPDTFDFGPALASLNAAGTPVMYVEGGWSPGFKAIGEELTRVTGGELLQIPAGHHFPHMADGGAVFNAAWQRFAGPPASPS